MFAEDVGGGGMLFDRTRIPLRTWFVDVWFVTSQENDVSALGSFPTTPRKAEGVLDRGVGLSATGLSDLDR